MYEADRQTTADTTKQLVNVVLKRNLKLKKSQQAENAAKKKGGRQAVRR